MSSVPASKIYGREFIKNRKNARTPPEVPSQLVGEEFTVPAGHAGSDHIDPGPITEWIMRLDFKLARKGEAYKSKALEELHKQPTIREPLTRSSRNLTCAKLTGFFERNIVNIESALIQIVGTISTEPCTPCLKKQGPWAKCVVFKSPSNLTQACGNCHWSGKGPRCDFYSEELARAIPAPGHKRNPSAALKSRNQQLETQIETLANQFNTHTMILSDLHQAILRRELIILTRVNDILQTPAPNETTYNRLRLIWPEGMGPDPGIVAIDQLIKEAKQAIAAANISHMDNNPTT